MGQGHWKPAAPEGRKPETSKPLYQQVAGAISHAIHGEPRKPLPPVDWDMNKIPTHRRPPPKPKPKPKKPV